LGALIEVLSNMSFDEYLHEAIFKPLGLENASFFITDKNKYLLAKKYLPREEDGTYLVNEEELDGVVNYDPAHRFMSGGAGLLMTTDELCRFANMLSMGGTLDGVRIIGRKTIDLMRENHLNAQQLASFRAAHANGWGFLAGYGYGLGVRTMIDKQSGGANSSLGEFGWAGATGTYLAADPDEEFSITYVQQMLPNPYEGYCHPRLRAASYALLD